MDFTRLNELMKIQKKSEASKADRQEYLTEMGNLFAEESYSANTEKYLYEGFLFAGAEPLSLYIKSQSLDARMEILTVFTKSRYYKDNERGIAFKMLVSLFCQTINMFPEEVSFFKTIIRDLPAKSINKERLVFKDTVRTIEKYFVSSLHNDVSLPDLSQLNLEPKIISEFCNFFLTAMLELNSKTSENKNVIKRIIQWLDTQSGVKDDLNTAGIQVMENDTGNGVTPTTESGKTEKALEKADIPDFIKLVDDIKTRLVVTVDQNKFFKEKLNLSRNKISELEIEISTFKKENINLKEVIAKKVHEYKEILLKNQSLTGEISLCRNTLAEQEDIINTLNNENVRLNSIISVYSADKQNAQSEQLNAIASKLKAEYMDFKEVEQEEISLDLGENFRQQIKTIFKILVKSGINVERR